MPHHNDRIIEPRVATPAPSTHTTSGGRLPDDLASEHLKRLSVFAAVAAGLWTYGLVIDTIVTPLTSIVPPSPMAATIECVAIVGALLMFGYTKRSNHPLEVKSDAALVFMVLNAMAVALINTQVRFPDMARTGSLSWNTVVVLVSSMIMSTTPRKMLIGSLIAASTDPLGIWLAHLRGVNVPGFVDTIVYFTPNYACAIVAALPAQIFQKLNRRLRHAREMGSYHLEELLGRGGMGEVWRGRHRLLARGAAIKLVRPELIGASSESDAQSMLRRFEREAQATASLSSPHTIQLFDFGVTADRTFYYVMELLTGRDLDSLVRQFGPVPAARALFLLRQVCHSLADAHSRGVVHRDVTPSNIYVCRLGLEYDFVKVLDFGLVAFDDPRDMGTTMGTAGHTTTGTPAFMAPEIILEGAVDQRADVYALGCVAYFLLTGQVVFEAESPMQMFLQHLHTRPIPPSQRTELRIPRQVDALVLACLEKDPAKRPQDAKAVLRLIEACQVRQEWDEETARVWWEQHIPELTGPLTVVDAPQRPTGPAATPPSAGWRGLAALDEPVAPLDPAAFSA
jgi:eukaryotic-like serine/threonine-protein kinase